MQRQNSGSHQSGSDYNGCRGRLNQSCDDYTEQKCLYGIVGHLFHDKPHGGAGVFFQGISHQAHAVQEQCKASKERNNI